MLDFGTLLSVAFVVLILVVLPIWLVLKIYSIWKKVQWLKVNDPQKYQELGKPKFSSNLSDFGEEVRRGYLGMGRLYFFSDNDHS